MPNHPLQCRCGTLRGHVLRPGLGKRMVCYCKDCQAFARFLGPADAVLDENGGTEIVATLPRQVHFSQGLESLACMSLSHGGLLRWYAACCKTPIANTTRDFKMPYVGVIAKCLQSQSPSLQESFGPVQLVLNTASARGPVKAQRLGNLRAMLGLMKSLVAARLRGAHQPSPFFDAATGAPIVRPVELTTAQRDRLMA